MFNKVIIVVVFYILLSVWHSLDGISHEDCQLDMIYHLRRKYDKQWVSSFTTCLLLFFVVFLSILCSCYCVLKTDRVVYP